MRTPPVRLFRGIFTGFLLCSAVAAFGQDEPVQAFRGFGASGNGEALTLLATAGGARIELPGGRAVQVVLPERAELTALAAIDGGWLAAGTVLDASGHQRLFLLRGNDRASRPLAEPPGQEGRQRRGPVFLVDGGRLAGLAWLEGEDDRSLSVRAALWNGQRWQAPERVSFPGPGSQVALAGAVLTDGSWLLAWSAFDGEDDEIVWARRAGNAWQPVKRLSAGNSVPDITPALTATADGGALIAWNHFDGKGYELRTARFKSEGWRDERAAAPAGSLFPRFLGDSRLLYVNAVPHAWTVLDLDATGRVKARASVPSTLDRPVVTFEGAQVRMRWPAEKRQAAASLEKTP